MIRCAEEHGRKQLALESARLDKQITRARKLALAHDGLIAELYLIHAAICEGKRKANSGGPSRLVKGGPQRSEA